MADFDEYRKQWIYHCPNCNNQITAFRDCGELTPCRCGGNFKLVNVIEPKHIEYNGESITNIHTFKPYFDYTLGKVIESKSEITEYCKKNNCIYAGDKELSQECNKNKKYNREKADKEFRKNLTEKLMQI